MKHLLVVYHTQFGNTGQLAEAALAGARGVPGVDALLRRAADAGVADVLAADALLIAASENFGGVAGMIKDSTVCALTRTSDLDVQKAGEAIRPAARGRIHVFIAASPIHMEMKLRMRPEEVLEAAVRAVRLVPFVTALPGR